jgi:PAP_fibrillin
MVIRAGLLDFLTPVAGKTIKKPARTAELVDELLQLTQGTEAGLKTSGDRKQEIEGLVNELSEYCMRSPLRSDLIFGEWEVVYASKPQTAGGPFRSPIGRTVFPGQRATQIIAEPNVCINEVSYKALGFVPGSARQEGEIEPINETTFQITFPGQVGKKTGGPPTRLIEVAYLDERIRVAKALPQTEDGEESFYVFVRVDNEEEEEEIEEEEEEIVVVTAPVKKQKSRAFRGAPVAVADNDDEEEEIAKPRGALSFPSFGTQIFKKSEGRATQAERSVAARGGQVNQTRGGTQIRGGAKVATAPAPPAQRKSREELAAERAAAKAAADEERREAAAAAAAARAQAEEDRRRAREEAAEERRRAQAAAQAEREAAAQRQAAARESYQELSAAATEAASEAKNAAAAYKSAEKEASTLLRAAAQARSIISKAVSAAE